MSESPSPWPRLVAALEAQGDALRSGRGDALEATNRELEELCSGLDADAAYERDLVQRAQSLARQNALLLISARDQVASALKVFQSRARTGLA